MQKKKTLRKKILVDMIAIVIAMMLLASGIFYFTLRNVSNTLTKSSVEMSDTIRELSTASMTKLTEERLMELASSKADVVDAIFADFQRAVEVTAAAAESIYMHPEIYQAREVPIPDPKNEGILTPQVLYSASTNPDDPKITEERQLLGNVQDVLLAINSSQPSMASLYVATESGFMVQVDYISSKKYDDQGNLMPLEAKERPWYQGASSTLETYFTPVTKDAHTPRLAIMCGVPVIVDGQLKGVAGAGMYLDDLDVLVQNIETIAKGQACIINQDGQILFSTSDASLLEAKTNGQDLRDTSYPEFSEMIKKAVNGEKGVSLQTINDVSFYAAYAPMKTVGWSMLVLLSQSEVEEPTEELLTSLSTLTEEGVKNARTHVSYAYFLFLTMFGVSLLMVIIVSTILSKKIVKPIQTLTEKVGSMEGDNLDFHWDMEAEDETQSLATSFESLTQRMKSYITDIQDITAERERIGTELALAKRIQAAMLPSIFPAFPNRNDFDIYASMNPAREVGGDFYDFFLTDEDHLCLVMADVSGKGVPAALFMTISKIILQSRAKMGQSPAQILTETNRAICANNTEDMFVTLWLGILELSTGKLVAANAGHEYPAFKKPNGKFELIKDKHGCAVGAFDDAEYEEYELQLMPGSKIFLYTDGVPEAKGKNGFSDLFGNDRMLEALNVNPEASPKQILEQIDKARLEFVQDEEQFDDVTMLCLEYKTKREETL